MDEKTTKLKVKESFQEDAYKGIARINTIAMKQLGVRPADVVLIKGNKETVAIVDKAYPSDVGEPIVRIDGLIRGNAKTSIGEVVTLTKVEVKEAKKIIIAPAQKGIMVKANNTDVFKRGLLGRAVVKGDMVVMGGAKSRHDLMADSPFEEMFGGGLSDIFGEAFGSMGFQQFGSTRFVIALTTPKEPVIITENTEVVLNPTAIELTEEKVIEVTYEDIGG